MKKTNLCNNNRTQANIRLDEDVLKTSFVFVFRRRLQDVFIKTNIFALIIRLQKTSWSRPIYSSWQYVFKTSSRRFEDAFKASYKKVFQTSSRRLAKKPSRRWRIIRLNYLPRSRICLGHTSEKFMVSVENLQVW